MDAKPILANIAKALNEVGLEAVEMDNEEAFRDTSLCYT